MKKLNETANADFNRSMTENGAIGYRTEGRALVDLNFAVTSIRRMSDVDAVAPFQKAFFENKLIAVKWLFFAGDMRGGLGERRLFRLCMDFLVRSEPELATRLLPLIPEYTRWDNLVMLVHTSLKDEVIKIIKAQLETDVKNQKDKKPISLLAKWLPSVNATSKSTRQTAKIIMSALGMTAKQYRQTLSSLRRYSDVTEVKTSANEWYKIDYAAVPSGANLLYAKAFMAHDPDRRKKYLDALARGETKINAGTLFPHDIVRKYNPGGFRYTCSAYDETLEQLWKALPDYVCGDGSTLCVADGSGSMYMSVGQSGVRAIDVADALAIYFAEHCSGQFKDTYITFSEHPQIISFAHCKTLHDKIGVAMSHNEVANTNIEAVFDLILKTAVKHKMRQKDLPKNVLIISDMEFDYCSVDNSLKNCLSKSSDDTPLFEVLAKRYAAKGYSLPRLVFWNVCGRTLTIPLRENKLGVALVSGFSPSIAKMVLSGKLDPYDCIIEQLNADRYNAVEQAFPGK